jgi:hypothetical protein
MIDNDIFHQSVDLSSIVIVHEVRLSLSVCAVTFPVDYNMCCAHDFIVVAIFCVYGSMQSRHTLPMQDFDYTLTLISHVINFLCGDQRVDHALHIGRNSIIYVITESLERSFEIFSFEGTSFDFGLVSSNYISV